MGESNSDKLELQIDYAEIETAYIAYLNSNQGKQEYGYPWHAWVAGAQWAATLFPPTPGINVPGGM